MLVLKADVYPDRREPKRFEPRAKPIRLLISQGKAGVTCNQSQRWIHRDISRFIDVDKLNSASPNRGLGDTGSFRASSMYIQER